MKDILIEKINKSDWWHVSPKDSDSYKKRGKFLASTYQQAEFYGKPNNKPETVKKIISNNPLIKTNEHIQFNLFDL
ncbi:MAG: hypothetical protein P1P79_09945 [Lutibacter sp.]|nr:hypothetical protein [Lutibacter sp.]